MADETYIDAQNLTEDTSLDGEEQFVMFDDTMGKRVKLKDMKTYMTADVAKPDGDYPDLKVGNADVSAVATAIAGGSYTEESVPYKFRHTGGDVTAGGAEEDCIVGGTIAWNQIVKNGNFANSGQYWSMPDGGSISVANNVATLTFNSSQQWNHTINQWEIPIVANHRYLVIATVQSSTKPSEPRLVVGDAATFVLVDISSKKTISAILSPSTTQLSSVGVRFTDGQDTGTATAENIMCFDLTQMFGSSVADYIYSLEQSSAGKGVAFFRNMFPEDYYEYNAGELKSVSGLSAHVTTGFNQVNESWENGGLNRSTGEPQVYENGIRSKDFVRVKPSESYFVHIGTIDVFLTICYYDANKQFMSSIGEASGGVHNGTTFTVPSGAHYAKFGLPSYGTTYRGDICINISSGRNGEYEPYSCHSYALDPSLTLRGVPRLVDNKVCFDGDEYRVDGTVTRRFILRNMGELPWQTVGDTGNLFMGRLNTSRAAGGYSNAICDAYPMSDSQFTELQDKHATTNMTGFSSSAYVVIKDSSYTSAADLKAALNGKYILTESLGPTTETASAYVNPQACDEYGTEEYISTSLVPVGHKTKYYDNLTKRIDKLPSAIAPLERSATASANYSVGDYLILNNTLYKVTSAISAGGTITAGSNVTATTIMAEIKALR